MYFIDRITIYPRFLSQSRFMLLTQITNHEGFRAQNAPIWMLTPIDL